MAPAPIEMSAGVLAAGRWQIMSDFPARIVADPLPEDEPDAAAKYSRIFLPKSGAVLLGCCGSTEPKNGLRN